MEYIEHAQSLEKIIRDQIKEAGSSSPKTSLTDNKQAYRQMANIMLQLSTIGGSAIGFPSVPKSKSHKRPVSSSLAKVVTSSRPTHQLQSRISRVHRRFISQSISDLVISGGIPPSVLPPINKTYSSSDEHYQAMAGMHLPHLALQHNNAVTSPPDGREKYIARQLFRKLAREGRLTRDEDDHHDNTPAGKQKKVFKLWCDDMRPASVLLDDNDDVVGVIDWEMSYFAPTPFHDNPPWWLIINKPEFFTKGISAWAKEVRASLALVLGGRGTGGSEAEGT